MAGFLSAYYSKRHGQTSPGRLAPCGEGQIPWLYLHILTDFAVNAKSWAELLLSLTIVKVYYKDNKITIRIMKSSHVIPI